ncbi:MAG: hypothetical protein J7L23_00330 [Candidatus Diapherotrites archaeon]|nr:hypothetical protein [Candidatus Diapherotrites archaeon]
MPLPPRHTPPEPLGPMEAAEPTHREILEAIRELDARLERIERLLSKER